MNRRTFLRRTALAGTVGLGLAGWRPSHALAEPPPETTRIRMPQSQSICVAPQYIVNELLKTEGFTDIQYVKMDIGAVSPSLATGTIDFTLHFAAPLTIQLDAEDPIVVLGGVHVGCFELFTNNIGAVHDLKGKTIAVTDLGLTQHVFLAVILAYVGLDPRRDVTFVKHPAVEGKRLLAEGKIDAYLGFPPDPQELRAKRIGRVIVNSALDRPWSQYFCCFAAGHREFVKRHPVATKRALRAILKAADVCALEPERAARSLVDRGFTPRYDYALQTMKEVPYDRWRVYDPSDTLRFYALRLHEAGMIKSSPQKILALGTDWRFLNDLKRELKG